VRFEESAGGEECMAVAHCPKCNECMHPQEPEYGSVSLHWVIARSYQGRLLTLAGLRAFPVRKPHEIH